MKECSLKYILAGIVIGYFIFRPEDARQTVDQVRQAGEQMLYQGGRQLPPAVPPANTQPTGVGYVPRYGTKSKSI